MSAARRCVITGASVRPSCIWNGASTKAGKGTGTSVWCKTSPSGKPPSHQVACFVHVLGCAELLAEEGLEIVTDPSQRLVSFLLLQLYYCLKLAGFFPPQNAKYDCKQAFPIRLQLNRIIPFSSVFPLNKWKEIKQQRQTKHPKLQNYTPHHPKCCRTLSKSTDGPHKLTDKNFNFNNHCHKHHTSH